MKPPPGGEIVAMDLPVIIDRFMEPGTARIVDGCVRAASDEAVDKVFDDLVLIHTSPPCALYKPTGELMELKPLAPSKFAAMLNSRACKRVR